jgi:glutaminyl-peptide cyclotransferase
MNFKPIHIIVVSCVVISGMLLSSCNTDNNKDNNVNSDSNTVANNTSQVNITKPVNLANFVLGEKIDVEAALPGELNPDSVSVFLNGKKQIVDINSLKFNVSSDSAQAGNNRIVINAWSKGVQYSGDVSVVLRSNIVPQQYTYKIIKNYPHDPNSYTQGLIFENNYMYEGTGQPGESMLMKYKLSNHELVQSYNLPEDNFGEGIVISNNHIYQLTWQSHVAYEYEKESFKLINKFDFSTEGWGITNLGKNLVMSDGSYTLYVLSPESFNEIKRIQVYDNIGPVNMLNELELIDGKIYANIYQTDYIVIIEPSTGCVIGKIDLSGLLDITKVKERESEVLNGIAWDEKGKRLFLTGKYWPEIYEVQLVKK